MKGVDKRKKEEEEKNRPRGLKGVKVFTFNCPSLLPCFGRVRAVDPAVCFATQEGLFDAEGLTGGFRGGLRPAAGCAVGGEKVTAVQNEFQWLSTMDESQRAMRSPSYLIMLYSLIFRLIKS